MRDYLWYLSMGPMDIPVVPFVPHTAIVTKTIIYSDDILPFKDSGQNLKICSISDIDTYALESCIKKIFESNPDVLFYTVQYSKEKCMVYFYTNKAITTKAWEESNFSRYDLYKTYKDIKPTSEEIVELFTKEKIKDTDCISLYDVSNLIKKYNHEYECLKYKYCKRFNDVLKKCKHVFVREILDFYYDKEQLKVAFSFGGDYEIITFSKKNDDLFVEGEDLFKYNLNKILPLIKNDLLALFDEFMKFARFHYQFSHCSSVNSCFLADIDYSGVHVRDQICPILFDSDFELFSRSYETGYEYKCKSISADALSLLRGNEDEFFKRIFVCIDSCPGWSRPILYRIRQEQLAEEERLEKEKLAGEKGLEMRKQKKLKRKFLSDLNKK